MFLGISFVPFRPHLLFTPSLQWTKKESDEKNDSIRFPFINGGKKSSSFLNVVLEEHVVRYTFVRVRCNLGTFVYYSAFYIHPKQVKHTLETKSQFSIPMV